MQQPVPASLAPNLAVLRWWTGLKKQQTMLKIKDLIEALGHTQGSLRARQISKDEWRVRIYGSLLCCYYANCKLGHMERDGICRI